MAKIIIGFSTSNHNFAIGAEAIKLFMNRPFSHTYFKYKDDLYTDHTIFHAIGKGLSYVSENMFIVNNKIIKEFSFEIENNLYHELLIFCHKNAGIKYGFLQNIGVAIVKIANKLGFKINKNPLNDGVNCSEIMFYILKHVYGNWINKDPNLVDPEDVYNFLEQKYGKN